jgi:hypothetical protein
MVGMARSFPVAVYAVALLLAAWAGGAAAQQGVGSIITRSVFDNMLKQRNNGACPAKGFYTYNAFITAARAFPSFGNTGDLATRKRELAAFFGQTSHETTGTVQQNQRRILQPMIYSTCNSVLFQHFNFGTYVQEGRGVLPISSSGATASRKNRARRTHLSTDADPFS